jgi:hypothetical protein
MGNVSVTNELSSRPERSGVEGPAVHSTRPNSTGSPLFVHSGAYPDFLLAALERTACAVFCKENRMEFATPPTLTGNPG